MQQILDLKSSLPDGSFQRVYREQNLEADTLSKGGVALSDDHMIYEYRVDGIICGHLTSERKTFRSLFAIFRTSAFSRNFVLCLSIPVLLCFCSQCE